MEYDLTKLDKPLGEYPDEEAEAERDRLRAALTIYSQSGNWRLGGCCDPNSPNFTGEAIARAALKGDSDE